MTRRVGTWFYQQVGDRAFELYRQDEDGPHFIGILHERSTAEHICRTLNDAADRSG